METIVNYVLEVLAPTVAFWGVFGFVLKEFVEYIKGALRGVHGLVGLPAWAKIGGYGSLFLAAFFGIGSAYQWPEFMNIFRLFESLGGIDPELGTLISGIFGTGLARFWKAKEKASKP